MRRSPIPNRQSEQALLLPAYRQGVEAQRQESQQGRGKEPGVPGGAIAYDQPMGAGRRRAHDDAPPGIAGDRRRFAIDPCPHPGLLEEVHHERPAGRLRGEIDRHPLTIGEQRQGAVRVTFGEGQRVRSRQFPYGKKRESCPHILRRECGASAR